MGNNQLSVLLSQAQLGHHVIKLVHNSGAQPISEILHVENCIVCSIETYLIPIVVSPIKTCIEKHFVCEICVLK